jgi:hypothetical protein
MMGVKVMMDLQTTNVIQKAKPIASTRNSVVSPNRTTPPMKRSEMTAQPTTPTMKNPRVSTTPPKDIGYKPPRPPRPTTTHSVNEITDLP